MKNKSKEELIQLDIQNTGRMWARDLEMSRPEGCSEDEYAEFCNDNKRHLKEIESFILIVNDWVE